MMIVSLIENSSELLAGAPDYKEEFEKEFVFSPGGSLTLSNICGQIEISGWEEDRIEIYALKTVSGDLAPELAGELMAQVTVEVVQEGNSIEVKTEEKNPCNTSFQDRKGFAQGCGVEVSYWIKVPRRTDIQLRSLNSYAMLENLEGDIELSIESGSILLQELAGELELNLVNGPILLENVQGALTTNTINGSTQARLQEFESARLNTTNGKITLELPATAAVDLEAFTLTGELKIDPRLKTETCTNKRNFESKINGGGPPIKIYSMRGPILIYIY
jgi:hypothetical protein